MTDVRPATTADEKRWNAFVDAHPHGNPFHRFEFADIHAAVPGRTPIALVAEHHDAIQGVLLGYLSTEKKGVFAPLSRRGLIVGGPLADGSDVLQKLLAAYEERIKGDALYSELRPTGGQTIANPRAHKLRTEDRLNNVIDLTTAQKALWGNLRRDKRRAVQKAEKKSLRVSEETGREGIRACYRLLEETYAHHHLPLADSQLFTTAFAFLHPPGILHAFTIREGDAPIACRILLAHQDTVYDWYAGFDYRFRDHYPTELLVWHALTWSKDAGYATFDFGGAGKKGDPYSVRDFKRGFGGTLIEIKRYQRIHQPLRYALAATGYRLARRFIY